MNESHLFRGISTETNQSIIGYLMDENYINVPINDESVNGKFDEPVEVKPETVSRCTGKPDVDGSLLFVGDLIIVDSLIGYIRFGEYSSLDGCDMNLGFYIEWIGSAIHQIRRDFMFWANQGMKLKI